MAGSAFTVRDFHPSPHRRLIPAPPNATGYTIETFALDILNSDLRPFLAKWAPVYETFAKDGKADSQAWPDHKRFGEGLRELQGKIEGRARRLAHIAGVKTLNGFFNCKSRNPR